MILTDKITDLITAQIPNLYLKNIDQQANMLLITTVSSQPTSSCPTCGTASSSIHSHYQRGLRDLPAHGASVTWELHARRFRCRNPTCKQRVFCERYPTGLNARARRTIRLTQTLEHTSLTVGASVGARIAQSFKAPVSISTLLRIAHQSEAKSSEKPKVIGVDDFAFRRGIHYGTVIVDLERSVVVDVLPDRNANTLKTWLKQNPQLEIISRDRSSEYARAINEGAPQAQQVLDRWHVLKNVREALERFPVRFRKPIAEICKAFEATQIPRNKRTKGEQALRNEAHARRVARFEKVRAALELGKTIAEIARDLHVSKWFVRCCTKTNEVPALRQNARVHSILDPFADQLEGLWRSGIRNAKQFWRELHDAGFKGSYKRVHQWVQAKQVQSRLLEPVPEATPEITEISDALVLTKKTARTRSFAPLALAWLLTMEDESLDDEDKRILEQLGIKCPDVLKARALVLDFSRLLKAKESDRLNAWFESVKASGIPDLSRFAVSLERERAALENAVRLPWSNGPVEGTVNRIKLLKRQGYGRASFSLLRKRILGSG